MSDLTSDEAPILSGAEPWSAAGGAEGVLVLHGFTGCPQSMRGQAEALATAGFTVELPRLPGHGTTVEDMLTTSWDDWFACADASYRDLAERCEHVAVMGLSMGGTLALSLAARHRAIAAIVLVNAAAMPMAEMADLIAGLLASGEIVMDAISNDVAKPGVVELAYDKTPLEPLATLGTAIDELQSQLGDITCPAMVMNAPDDHVVPSANGDHVAERLGGTVERLSLDRSYHVATIDHDADLISEATVDFLRRQLT